MEVISITSLGINNAQWQLTQGSTALIGAEIRRTQSPQRLVDVDAIPLITMWNPLEELIVDGGEMTRLSLGRYGYAYTTRYRDLLGVYTANFTVQHQGYRAQLQLPGVFLLTKGHFTFYDYLVMQDVTGTLWYWWVDAAGQLVSLPTIPPEGLSIPLALADGAVYSAIVLDHPDGYPVYAFPDIAGQPVVDTTPPVGLLHEGSPLFRSPNRLWYILSVDVINQIVVTQTTAVVA